MHFTFYWSWGTALDCVMTTVCTGRALPDASPDGTVQMTDQIFNATVAQSEYTYAYQALYNDSIWGKFAVGNTAWHMKNNLQSIIDNTGRYNTPAADYYSSIFYILLLLLLLLLSATLI